MSFSTFNANAATYSGTCGDNLNWTLNMNGNLSISGSGSMYNWGNYTEVPWYDVSSSITSVYIGKDVTNIGDYAFAWCQNIKDITIGGSVGVIGRFAFSGCTSLSRISIPSSVYKIYDTAFDECSKLSYIYVDINNSYYSSDSNEVLYNKDKTVLVKYPPGNGRSNYDILGGVTEIGISAFDDCNKLTSITIPDSVNNIGIAAFSGCTSLTSVIIGNGVTTIGGSAFYRCSKLTSITIPESVTAIGECSFRGCYSLADVYYCGTEEEWNNISIGTYNESLLNATIHYSYCPHSYESVVTAPTCTEHGYTTYTCECGDSYVDDYVEATGHSHTSEITTPATHTTTGVMTYTCSCGDTYTETIEKIAEHNHNAVVTAPTCTEQGYTTFTCECGDSYVDDYVPEKGHDEGIWSVTKPSTPTESGVMHLFCGECGFVLETKVIPATGKVRGVAISDVSLDYKASTTITPSITVDSGVKYTVTYSSSNPSVASVDANGKVVAGKTGSATITVTVTDEFGNTVSDTCTVKVNYNWWQWIIVIVLFGWIWY
ncbi:MAG: leucine-rich repeat protein [Clostridia bacterium]|nr:leucine-rich repeat protein [Clostridia bacterium]